VKPRVLIGYSRDARTRDAFERAGCDAWTCDLLPADHAQHLQCDIWQALREPWDFAVLHPMCTYLTVSAAWAYKDPDYNRWPGVGYHQSVKAGTLTGRERREARDRAVRNFCALMALPFPVVAENPAPSFLNTALCPPHQIVQPWQFGDDASKSTGLWWNRPAQDIGLPYLTPRAVVAPRYVQGKPRWANQTDSGQNRVSPSATRWLERSATYPGVAKAMGTQWGAHLVARGWL